MKNNVGKKEVRALKKPKSDSHKGDNGQLLIIAGSKKYHGALLLTATIASKIVDLVYVFSDKENQEVIKKLKPKLFEFISIPRNNLDSYIKRSDVLLIGPGLGVGKSTKSLVNNLIRRYPNKKFVLDADALKVVNKNKLNKNCIVTPHQKEFQILFKTEATESNVKKMAKKHGCIIVLKGKKDLIVSPSRIKYNTTGNQGMTKGGTGDVLAGLIAALACTNDLFLSACTGAYLNGLAADRLKQKVSYYYSASDLIQEIPKTMKKIQYKRILNSRVIRDQNSRSIRERFAT